MKINFLRIILLLIIVASCNDDGNIPITRKSIYHGEYYNLVKAISNNNTNEMQDLVTKYSLDVNHRDSVYGITLLEWALDNYKKKAFKKLLDMGANPNFRDSISHIPVILQASKLQDIDYLQYCLDHKGNPNITSVIDTTNGDSYTTPLSAATNGRAENINLLVKYGADVNYSPDNFVPLTSALVLDLTSALTLLKHGVDPKKVRYATLNRGTLNICQMLREIEEVIPSDDYTTKMAIVKYLKDRYNIDYFATNIPEAVKKSHDATYLSKY